MVLVQVWQNGLQDYPDGPCVAFTQTPSCNYNQMTQAIMILILQLMNVD